MKMQWERLSFLQKIISCSVLACAASLTHAQTPGTGAIDGLIVDSAHHPAANVEVSAIDEATQAVRTTRSDTAGLFRMPLLLPGSYTVVVNADGFGTNRTRGIRVTTGEVSSLNIALEVAKAIQNVQVSGTVEAAQTESSTLGGLVNAEAIAMLPLSNRNFTQILALSPGIVVDLPNAGTLGTGTENVSSDGATPTANNIQFNGIDANNLVQNSAANSGNSQVGTAIPAPDTIQEFQVQTANYDAAYGRGSGANVDLISRSGSNTFHGGIWEFARNNIFNANEFFTKQEGQPRPELKQNQFGGTVGGPVLRNKLYFFGAYQGTRSANGLGGIQHPILPLLSANRSAASLGAQFCSAAHLNAQGEPASGYLTQAGGVQVACDGSNINPVALAILNAKLPNGQFLVPSPQTVLPVSGSDASNQLPLGESSFAPPAYYDEDQFTVDLDKVLSSKNTLDERFFWARSTIQEPFSPSAANVPGWGTDALNRNTDFVVADTDVLTPNAVNVARFGYIRFDGISTVQNSLGAAAIGQSIPTGAPDASSRAPGLTVGGFTVGDAGTPSSFEVTNSLIWQDMFAFTKGRNTTRFGLEIKRFEVDEDQPEETDGLLQIDTFDDFLLGESAAQNGSPQGLSNVSLAFAGGGIFRRDTRYTDFAGFAQDDVKVTSRLTVNAGLRYEIFSAPTETNGRLANFNPLVATTGSIPAAGTFNGFTLPANFVGTLPAGYVRTPYASQYRTPHGDVSPRLGFAWQLTGQPAVVLRGGYGLYYDRHSNTIAEQTLDQPPFATLQIGFGAPNGPATLGEPFVPFVQPPSSFPAFVPRSAATSPFIEGLNPGLQDGRTQEYNLNVQYVPGHNYVLQVGYVGTASTHRSGQVEFDQALLASPGNPVNGETTNSIGNVAARLPVQGISQGSLLTDSVFIGSYNALQATLIKQLGRGLQLQASYTWSKNLDEVNGESGTDTFELQLPTNNQLNLRHSSYGLAGDDRDQRFVFSFEYTSPQFGSVAPRARYLLSNWQFSGIAVLQAGIPLSIFDGNAGSVYGLLGGEVRAERTGNNPSTHGSLFARVTGSYLDAHAFTRAPEAPFGTSLADQDFGNSSIGIVRGPGQHNLDFAIERAFPVGGAQSLHFRTEFFNLTNTPQFGNPDTSLGYSDPTLLNPVASQNFGRITGTVANPRIIQFAGKFLF